MAPPLINLDPSLASLYSLDGGNSDDIALVYAVPHPTKIAKSLPVSVKYAYQAPRMANQSRPADLMALFCLGTVAQYFAFTAGPMALHLFDPDAPGATSTHREDATRVFAALAPSHRPTTLSFINGTTPPHQQLAAIPQKLATITPMDVLDAGTPLIAQDAHWALLSKRDLALAGAEALPSPATEVVDSALPLLTLPATEVEEEVVTAEVERMLAKVARRELPFVVKMPHGLGSHAVFILRSEASRGECLRVLREELPWMLRGATAATPVSLLLQEFVGGASLGVSAFVTRSGRAVFLSCAEQILGADDCWAGGLVDYRRQGGLEARYRDVVERVARYVFERGYWGPMGVDVMVDGETGRQVIVDMNIRHTGDLTLGLMRRHLWEDLGLPVAWLDPAMVVRGDRDRFEEVFREEMESGAMVIAGWCHVEGEGGFVYSIGGVVVGAKDREELQRIIDRVALERLT